MLCNEDKGGYFRRPYLKSKNIQWLRVDVSSVDCMWFSKFELELYRLRRGDIILSEGGEVGKCCYWDGELPECYIQNSAHKVTFREPHDSRYFLYLFYALGLQGHFQAIVNRVSIAHLTWDKLANLKLLEPQLAEQVAIADYLDDKVSQVDKAICSKEQQINLLKERKQILIQNAVTRGLNPDAPMRDSGVDWIGEIPAHWEQVRLKNVSNFITSGPRGWSEYFSEHGAYFLQSGNLNESMGIEFGSAVKVNPPKGAEGLRTRLLDGDVLVCVTGAKTGKVALAKISDHQEVYVNQHLCLVRPTKSILPEFLALVLHSVAGQTYFFLQQYGLKQGLGLDDVNEAPILLPPSSEQQAIVDYVNAELIKQNKAALLLEQQITKLKEYKATLINSAVTGKIKVPGVVEPAQGMNEPEAREVCQ